MQIKKHSGSLCFLFSNIRSRYSFYLFEIANHTHRVSCSSEKSAHLKSGRIGANTGDHFFSYRRNFDMMYDTHKVKLTVFLLPK